MGKVCILGHYAYGMNAANGQTIKTKILTEELVRQFGEKEVKTTDTYGGIKSLIKAPFHVISALRNAKNVVILPAHNGVRVYGRLLPWLRPFFRGRKIHYAVIGGWLPKMLETKKGLARALKKFDGIYVETNTMKTALEAQGFENVIVMPNCKKLTILKADELTYYADEPYKLCTFSRVTKQKGIEDAINAVNAVNEELGRIAYTLDIYGQIDAGQEEWFDNLKKSFPKSIRYGGLVPFDKSVETLKDYFALLFPTRFYTEGIPGTIIDAYAAGVPVISSKWESFSDIIDDGITGIGYRFNEPGDLKNILLNATEKPELVLELKRQALKRVSDFIPETVVAKFVEYLE